MTEKQQQLRLLMAEHSVIRTYKQLAEFWGVSENTIHAYLKPVASKSNRNIPDKRLDQLKEKLRNNDEKSTGATTQQ